MKPLAMRKQPMIPHHESCNSVKQMQGYLLVSYVLASQKLYKLHATVHQPQAPIENKCLQLRVPHHLKSVPL